MKKNIAVVGCGQWGKNLIRNFFKLDALFSICDLNSNIANKYATQYKVKNYSFKETINNPNIKGVALVVPAELHAAMAIEAMNKGKHVLVEKPLSLNENDAKLMIECAKKNNVQLMVGHLLQYHPIFRNIKKLIKDNKIGKLNYIYSRRLSFGRVRKNEDVIWSFAPHDISMILSLANEDPELVKVYSKSILKTNLADIAHIHLKFKSGLNSDISVSWLNPHKEVKLVLLGQTGMLIFDENKNWNEKLAFCTYKANYSQSLVDLNKSDFQYLQVSEVEPLKIECEHFIDVVNKNIKPLTDGNEGMKVVKILNIASKNMN